VTVTLTPTGWVGGDTFSFTGQTTRDLRKVTAGAVTLGATSTPSALNVTQCYNGASPTCSLDFRTSGFIFDVPSVTACKTSGSVTITAVRADDTSQKCVPAFESGTRSVNFWSSYSNPAAGTGQVEVNGTPVATSGPGTGINLTFAAGAVSSFTVRYPDAGQMQLNARYEPGSGAESGLVMDGVDTFVSVPVGLAVIPSGGACVAGDASCAAYQKAGQTFAHTVRAACWTHDGDVNLADNPVTQNFQMANIPLSANLVAPSGGANATLGAATVTIGAGDGGAKAVNQSVSEVGVFTISATPAAGGYFGLTVPGATSPNIGRFYPDHFSVSAPGSLTPACSSATPFTYLGQAFAVSSVTLRAENTSNNVTQNYTGSFALFVPGTVGNWGLAARDLGGAGTALPIDTSAASVAGNWANGTLSASFSSLAIMRPASPAGPYNDTRIGVAPTDPDAVTIGSPNLDTDGVGGPDRAQIGAAGSFRFGRLRLFNAIGSELLDLPMQMHAQYWNNNRFVTNVDDGCTAVATASIGLDISLQNGGTTAITPAGTLSLSSGVTGFRLTKPGAGKSGRADLTPDLTLHPYLRGKWGGANYDQNPTARATFGAYKGSEGWIYMREVY
jgi:MSHA biogenesis protein MshQ